VIADNSAHPSILAAANATNGASWFNGNDAVVLTKGATILDVIGQVGTDPGSQWGAGLISTQNHTLRRKSSVCQGDTNPADAFTPATEWDGYAVNTFDGLGSHTLSTICTYIHNIIYIHNIQGNSTTSPLNGTTKVTIQGIVTGDFQTSSALNGFYVQEEDSEVDNDPLTAEGIFVYNNTPVQIGDLVTVTGTVTEFYELTELNAVTNVTVISSNHPLPTAAIVNLPLPDAFYLERFEGMLVTLPQTLTVTDTYDLPKYGEIVVANGRLLQPTQVAKPGPAANILQVQNDLNQLVIDDGRAGNYRTPFAYNFTANHPVRIGSTVTNLTGVLHYDFGKYRVHPTNPVTFTDNLRPPVPNLNSSLTVASFNVLNYFTTLGNGTNCGPAANQDCRGANTASELTRQQQKLVAALSTMNADIVGLMELENNGTALHQLVTQLNNTMGAGTYHYLNTGILGSQVITTGLIYKPAKVSPVGPFATKLNGAFAINNRVPLAQTFLQNSTGGKFTVVVNHLKSKGSCPNNGADADQGDGQSCWNASRRQAAEELTAWLAKDPTGSGDTDFLIIGDLNSYAQEDPITVLKQQGYTNLVEQFLGSDAYSFVFFGQAGTLDYALASGNLVSQITGVAEWHINADEHYTLDYNQENWQNSPLVAKPANFFQADPYRSTDHDPLLIGLTLLPSNGSPPAEETSAKSPQTVATVFTPPLPQTSTVFVEIQGTGQGRVNSELGLACETSHCTPVLNDDTGTQCEADACSETVNTGTMVILTPQAAPGSVFTSWGGHEDCADGRLTMNGNKLCIAFFQAIHQLTVTIHGPGTVKSHDYLYQSTGIQCGDGGNQCNAAFSYGTTTFLQAVPAKDAIFVGWGGHCIGTRNPLAVTVQAELTCEAHFQNNY